MYDKEEKDLRVGPIRTCLHYLCYAQEYYHETHTAHACLLREHQILEIKQ